MLEKLFTELFEKLKNEEENDSTSKSGCFKFFVERVLEERYDKPNYINDRTLVNYYNKYVEKRKDDTGEPLSELKNLIANYLGATNFRAFENKYQKSSSIDLPFSLVKTLKNKKIIVAFIIVIFTTILSIYKDTIFKSKDCIVWKTDHYIEVSCDIQESINNHLYNINITNFKKIIATDTTTFFINGKNIVWYGKSKNKKIEFFTDRGVHPITLKELKPITELIINKYVYSKKKQTLVD